MASNDAKAPTLHDREKAVAASLARGLADYYRLTALEHNLFVRCADAIADRSLSQSAAIVLVTAARVLGDLRVCRWAAEHGYAIQAQSIAASIHEIAFAAAYVGDSEERAGEWIAHSNERRQYPECGHSAVIDDVLKTLYLSKPHSQQEYGVYRQLCWAKHGNPLLQRRYGVTEAPDAREIEQIPYYSDDTLAIARFALFHAARAVATLLTILAKTHFLSVLDAKALEWHLTISSEIERLGLRDALFEAGPDGRPTIVAT